MSVNKLIYSIIPARAGSKGIPRKNVVLLQGYPLLTYSIAASRLCSTINRTIVSTDSEEIAEIALRYGAEVPFLRPKEFATDNSPDLEFVLHTLNWFKENENKLPDYLVHLRPTTPLRDPNIIEKAVSEIIRHPEATSLRSGHPSSESPFKWFLCDEGGYFKSILSGYKNEFINNPRQSFPTIYIPDGYVDVLNASFILHSNNLHGDKMIGFTSPFCTEIDTLEDLEYLEFELLKKGSPLLTYLTQNFQRES